jgi:hypothetical protein
MNSERRGDSRILTDYKKQEINTVKESHKEGEIRTDIS